MRSGFKFIHISDVHLGTEFSNETIIGKDSAERRQELWTTFQNILDFSHHEKVDFVLIAGDLFENDNFTVSNLDRLAYVFHQYSELEFYIALGNHDHVSPKSNYLKGIVGENVKIFDSDLEFYEIKELNIRIYGYSWDRKNISETPFNFPILDSDLFNILLIHTDAQSQSSYLPLNSSELSMVGFNYYAFGHIHYSYEVFENAYFSGSPEPIKFTNTGPHGCLLVSNTKGILDVQFKTFGTREYREIELNLKGMNNNLDVFQHAEKLLLEAKNGDYIRLTVTDEKISSINLMELEERLKENYKYLEIIDKTYSGKDIDLILEENRNNLIGEYISFVKNNYEENKAEKLIDIFVKGLIMGDQL